MLKGLVQDRRFAPRPHVRAAARELPLPLCGLRGCLTSETQRHQKREAERLEAAARSPAKVQRVAGLCAKADPSRRGGWILDYRFDRLEGVYLILGRASSSSSFGNLFGPFDSRGLLRLGARLPLPSKTCSPVRRCLRLLGHLHPLATWARSSRVSTISGWLVRCLTKQCVNIYYQKFS